MFNFPTLNIPSKAQKGNIIVKFNHKLAHGLTQIGSNCKPDKSHQSFMTDLSDKSDQSPLI
jgi:hypothetical protein